MHLFSRLRRDLVPLNLQFRGTRAGKTPAVLLPEERAAVSTALPARVRAHAAGRWCARHALAALGIAPRPLAATVYGAPVWPRGACGSIAHAAGAACAVAASTRRYRSLGIDLERLSKSVSLGALSLLANEDELAWLHLLRAPGRPQGAVFLATAKESAFKLLSPLVARSLPFTAFSLLPPVSADRFEVVLNFDLGPELHQGLRFPGRWFSDREWVAALSWYPAKR